MGAIWLIKNIFFTAKKVGLNVQALYGSCRKDNPEKVARELRETFGINIIDKLWIWPIEEDP